jgi:tetratricopeptide (TPR) repeat protein
LALPALGVLAGLMGLFAVHSTRIWVADSFYKQGQIGMQVGRWDYAVNVYQKAAGKLADLGQEDLGRILKPDPSGPRVAVLRGLNADQELYWVKLGIAYEAAAAAQTDPALKERAYLTALAIHHSTVQGNPINGYNYNNKGRVLKSMGEGLNRADYLRAAVEHYNRAIALDPNNVYFNLDLANTFIDLGEMDKAMGVVQRLAQLYPDFAMSYSYAGFIHMRQNRAAEAVKSFETALQKDWKGEGASRSLAASNLGLLQSQAGRKDAAIAAFRESVNGNPDYLDGWLNLARLLGKAGPSRRADARQAWGQVLRLSKDHPEALASLKALGG